MGGPGEIKTKPTFGQGTPLGATDGKTDGQMPATASGKGHKIAWLKDKFSGAKESMRVALNPLKEKISSIFSRKSENSERNSPPSTQPNTKKQISAEKLPPPPTLADGEEVVPEEFDAAHELDQPPPVPKRDDVITANLLGSTEGILKELKLLGHEKDIILRLLDEKSNISQMNEGQKTELREKLKVVDNNIDELTKHFEDLTRPAPPPPEDDEIATTPTRRPLPPDPPRQTKTTSDENEGISREGKRPLPPPPQNQPPPRPSRENFPLPDGTKARDK